MAEREYKTYGLNGEPETRIEREFDNVFRAKLDTQLEKKFTIPNVSTLAKEKPFLAKDAGNWYIYIRIDDTLYRTPALTAV